MASKTAPASKLGSARMLTASLLPFAVVGVVLWTGTRVLAPSLERIGTVRPLAFSAGLYLPFALLGALALMLAWREVGSRALARRLRLRHPGPSGWWLTAGVLVVTSVLEAALAPTALRLAALPSFRVPDTFPAPFDPAASLSLPPQTYLGMPIEGAGWLAPLAVVGLVANIAGEELFWRGWLLPIHERIWGRRAWLAHGLGWLLLVHAFMPWAWIALLPTTLAVPWLAQRTQSTWPALVVHGAGNAAFAGLVVVAAVV
jgi:membrane protease YdiL (CAAX protease family)